MYLIARVFNFAILWFWNFSRVQSFAKIAKFNIFKVINITLIILDIIFD